MKILFSSEGLVYVNHKFEEKVFVTVDYSDIVSGFDFDFFFFYKLFDDIPIVLSIFILLAVL